MKRLVVPEPVLQSCDGYLIPGACFIRYTAFLRAEYNTWHTAIIIFRYRQIITVPAGGCLLERPAFTAVCILHGYCDILRLFQAVIIAKADRPCIISPHKFNRHIPRRPRHKIRNICAFMPFQLAVIQRVHTQITACNTKTRCRHQRI